MLAGPADLQRGQRQAVRAEAVQDVPDGGLGLPGAARAEGGAGDGGGAAAQRFPGSRDSQSRAFFRPPGMLKLYSGVTMSRAPTARGRAGRLAGRRRRLRGMPCSGP